MTTNDACITSASWPIPRQYDVIVCKQGIAAVAPAGGRLAGRMPVRLYDEHDVVQRVLLRGRGYRD